MISPAGTTRLELRVTSDGMTAFARVRAGSIETSAWLDARLAAAGIVHGIDPAAYASLVQVLGGEEASTDDVEIAHGTPAGASRPGYFEAGFHQGLQPGHLREDGTMDFHDRELLKAVAVGEVLGRLHTPLEGASGQRVDGNRIAGGPAPPFVFRIGEGTELLADGRVRATRAGIIIHVEGRSIEIGTRYTHEGDVDLRSGDLSMEGSLVIRSDVQRGFCARASGDLDIKGGVDGSAYAGANLHVFGGVRGSEGSMVSAEGNLRAHHAERARLDCGGVLEVVDAVNSELSAIHIRVERSLRGGRAAVESGLVTRDAGAPVAHGETVIEAGVPREEPDLAAREALVAAKAQRLGGRRAPGAHGTTAERGKGGKFGRDLAGAARSALARKIERADRAHTLLPLAFIEVRGVAHAGVHVRIGRARLQLETAMRNVRFTLDLERQTIRTEAPKT